MKIVKIAIIIVILAIGSLILVLSLLPSEAHMVRKIRTKASPEMIYRELITFRNFKLWSPWSDSAASFEFDGPEFGVGARMRWRSSDPDIEDGELELIEAVDNEKVVYKMNFEGYYSSPSTTWIITPTDSGTVITWHYDEEQIKGINKLFSLGIEGFLGATFDKSLERLRYRLESVPQFQYEMTLNYHSSFKYIGLSDSSENDPVLVSSKMAQKYGEIMSFINREKLGVSGYPIAVFEKLTPEEVVFICGVPVDTLLQNNDELNYLRSYGGLVVHARFKGESAGLAHVHSEIKRFIKFYNYEEAGDPWETYIVDLDESPGSSPWTTVVYYPIK